MSFHSPELDWYWRGDPEWLAWHWGWAEWKLKKLIGDLYTGPFVHVHLWRSKNLEIFIRISTHLMPVSKPSFQGCWGFGGIFIGSYYLIIESVLETGNSPPRGHTHNILINSFNIWMVMMILFLRKCNLFVWGQVCRFLYHDEQRCWSHKIWRTLWYDLALDLDLDKI